MKLATEEQKNVELTTQRAITEEQVHKLKKYNRDLVQENARYKIKLESKGNGGSDETP